MPPSKGSFKITPSMRSAPVSVDFHRHRPTTVKTNAIARPYLSLMNNYKKRIIAKKLKVPTKL